jgi:hypothetical protein
MNPDKMNDRLFAGNFDHSGLSRLTAAAFGRQNVSYQAFLADED